MAESKEEARRNFVAASESPIIFSEGVGVTMADIAFSKDTIMERIVVMTFLVDGQYLNFALPIEQAREIGPSLIEHANKAEEANKSHAN